MLIPIFIATLSPRNLFHSFLRKYRQIFSIRLKSGWSICIYIIRQYYLKSCGNQTTSFLYSAISKWFKTILSSMFYFLTDVMTADGSCSNFPWFHRPKRSASLRSKFSDWKRLNQFVLHGLHHVHKHHKIF